MCVILCVKEARTSRYSNEEGSRFILNKELPAIGAHSRGRSNKQNSYALPHVIGYMSERNEKNNKQISFAQRFY